MKTVGKMKRAIIALAVTLCFAVVSCGVLLGTVRAHAADKVFEYGGLEGRTFIGGITRADIENAFEEEGARLKADMAQAGVALDTSGGHAPLMNGWEAFGGFLAAHLNLGNYAQGAGLWANDYAFMVFNPYDKKAYTVKGKSVNAYANASNGWKDQIVHLGLPKGNDFTIEETTYQNFSLGYTKNGQTVYGKNVTDAGVEEELTADDIAESMYIPIWYDTAFPIEVFKKLTISDYANAYKEYYADKDVNVNPIRVNFKTDGGKPRDIVWRQDIVSENQKTGEVIFNEIRRKMFAVTNTFLNDYYGNSAKWGAPVAEERTVTNATTQKDVVSQQFANGVAVLTEKEDETTEIVFHAAMKVDENGEIVSVIGADSVGAIADELISKLPQGVTAEAVKAAVQAKYDNAMGVPAALMEFAEGTNILVQRFVSNGGGTSEISLDVSAQTLTAVLLSAETYELYEKPTRFNEGNKKYDVTGEMILGPAITDAFAVGEKTYQNFLYGAIELTADEDDAVFPGVNYQADGTRTVLDLSAKIVIEDDVFIPNSYGNVGAADLLEKFQAAYKEYVQKGVALGMPNKEGIGAWSSVEGGIDVETGEFKDGQGMIKLGLHMTDSNAICYYGVTAMLAYSPEDGKVYILKDAVISNMANYYSVYGAPRGDLTKAVLTVDGEEYEVEIQNFQLGYLTVMGGSASMTADRNWDFELKGAVNLDGSRIPGVEYPGDKKPDEKPDDNEVEAGCGCGGDLTADGALFGGVAAVVTLGAAAAIVLAKKRKEDR